MSLGHVSEDENVKKCSGFYKPDTVFCTWGGWLHTGKQRVGREVKDELAQIDWPLRYLIIHQWNAGHLTGQPTLLYSLLI